MLKTGVKMSSRNVARRLFELALTCLSIYSTPVFAADQSPPIKAKPKPIIDAPFFSYVDNRLTYAHVFNTTDAGYYSPKPGGGYNGKTNMNVVAFTHFDTWAYGTNFFTVGWSKSDHNDPASPCTNVGVITNPLPGGGSFNVPADCAGAQNMYGLIRSTFGFNQIFDTQAFTAGPLHNVSIEVGADGGSQATYFASATRQVVAGLQFAFDLPYHGYINVAPLYKSELGHNAYTQCGSVFAPAVGCSPDGNARYKDTWALEVNYDMDLGFLPESVQFFSISGRVGVYGPKGPFEGVPGQEPTKTEINSEPIRVTFDAGRAFLGKKYAHEVDIWAAYRYTQNQFGNDANSAPFVCTVNGVSTNSCTTNAYATGMTLKF
ncbi:hypothetical protein [Bradyrhizobium canariense]|uniref:Uncharacterized protein n=1 Tax=Bradyrhizobium canariense TaxID=255045 RepID=A0A1H1YPR0_9BRAD|nr:hypothetical protein [Bradyrhizobium canariense]SDT23453.1 hypothetical protein SAMN05444158_4948 [Bradyrhizobium canariense]